MVHMELFYIMYKQKGSLTTKITREVEALALACVVRVLMPAANASDSVQQLAGKENVKQTGSARRRNERLQENRLASCVLAEAGQSGRRLVRVLV